MKTRVLTGIEMPVRHFTSPQLTQTLDQTPGAPKNFSAIVVSSTVIQLNWAADTSKPPPDDYDLDYSTVSGTGPWTSIPVGLSTVYNHTGQDVTQWHWYRLVAKNGLYASPSIFASARNQRPSFTLAPSSISLASSGGTIQFTAVDPDGSGITYSLPSRYRTDISINSSTGLVTVPSAAAGTTGNITVRATDGVGLFVDTICAITVAGTVTVPVDLEVLRQAGYKIVTDYYPNVRINDSSFDSRAGIQAAIDECSNLGYPLYFPAGTYYIGDSLWVEKWGVFDTRSNPDKRHHYLIGCSNPLTPSIIKPTPATTRFNNVSRPIPLLIYRTYYASTVRVPGVNDVYPTANPSDPWTSPTGWIDGHGNGFYQKLINFIIDTDGCVGAIGVHFGTCQNSWMHNIKVIGTGLRGAGAYCCFYGIGGTQGSTDLEGIGGRYGIMVGSFGFDDEQAGSGATGVSIRLSGQTVAAIYARDFTPTGIVGFDITLPSGTKLVYSDPLQLSSQRVGVIHLVDGIVRCNGQIALENAGVSMYARNVYVTGTNNVIKTGSLATVTATGTWKLVTEYVSKNPNGIAQSAVTTYPTSNIRQNIIIDGAYNTAQQAIASVTASSSAPPSDLVSRHSPIGQIPFLDDGQPYINVLSYGATRYYLYNNGTNSLTGDFGKGFYNTTGAWVGSAPVDSWTAFRDAIAAAQAAGHNRVLIPRGMYFMSQPLELKANTKLFGVGSKHSVIGATWGWVPTTSPTYLVSTVDNPVGQATLTSVMLCTPTRRGTQNGTTLMYSGDRFSMLNWRVGRRSLTWDLCTDVTYNPYPNNDRQTCTIQGFGGGRHYFMEEDGYGNANIAMRALKISGTTEPITVYGASFECSKIDKPSNWLEPANGGIEWKDSDYSAISNVEITDSQNVRIYENKREGNAGSYYIQNSSNIIVHGPGVNMGAIQNAPEYVRIKVYGSSSLTKDIAVVQHTVQEAYEAGAAVAIGREQLTEAITGYSTFSVPYWEGIAYYKRGNPNDSTILHTSPVVAGTDLEEFAAEKIIYAAQEGGVYEAIAFGASMRGSYATGGTNGTQSRVIVKNTRAYSGTKSLRFYIPGGGPLGDVGRSEVAFSPFAEIGTASYEGAEHFIGFALFLNSDWPLAESLRSVLFQQHTTDGTQPGESPVFGLRTAAGTYKLTTETGVSNLDVLVSPDLANDIGVWRRWVIHVKFSAGSSGFIRIYRDGVLLYDTGSRNTVAPGTTSLGFHKLGNYAAARETTAGAARESYFDSIRFATKASGGTVASVDPLYYRS